MSIDRHPDWYTTVRKHWRKTHGFLLASRQPCIAIRDRELKAIKGRSVASREPDDLTNWEPPESWVLAVILCPGDSIQPIVDWIKRTKADPERVYFYLHPSVHWDILEPWVAAGYSPEHVDLVSTWQELHKLFGLVLNDRVYRDWGAHR